jgi:uncharacterized repeat protein (TIGR03803 family)
MELKTMIALIDTLQHRRRRMRQWARALTWMLAAISLLAGADRCLAGRTETLYSFSSTGGQNVFSGILVGSDGNYYATSAYGGASGDGAIVCITPAGALTTVHSFAGAADGQTPLGGVIQGADGYLYGTTYAGGADGVGTVFKVALGGTGFTVLHTFTGGLDGANCQAGLVQNASGTLYGVAQFGGIGYGVVYGVAPNGSTFNTVYTFHSTDGREPLATLTSGGGTIYYGTTYLGGVFDLGVVFQIDVSVQPGNLTALYNFKGSDGANPVDSPLPLNASTLIGTTESGGAQNWGTAWSLNISTLNPNGLGGTLTQLYSFNYSDGAEPSGGLILGSDGNYYGTCSTGGEFGLGSIFDVTPSGQMATVHSFSATNTDGATPTSALLRTTGGFVGITDAGGAQGGGALYGLVTGSLFDLHDFAGTDGSAPACTVLQAADGNFYGTTAGGGLYGYGTVWSLGLDNAAFNSLHSFNSIDGAYPFSGLEQGPDTLLYGATSSGSGNYGTLFNTSTSGSFSSLYAFTGAEGAFPSGPLSQGSDGTIYGVTESGGYFDEGSFFVMPLGGILEPFYQFKGYPDGGQSASPLVPSFDGNFYGTASTGGLYGYGDVFEVSPNGYETDLHSFTINDGEYPLTAVTVDPDGNIYGTTSAGGANGYGTIYQLHPNGSTTVLHNFSGPSTSEDGEYPSALTLGNDGNLYGVTAEGGASGDGTIFEATPSGQFSTITSFSTSTPGNTVALSDDGNFYGVANTGGGHGDGAIYEWSPNPIGDPAPGLTAIGPTWAYSGSGSLTLTVEGVNFAPGALVEWNGAALSTTFVSGTQLTATVPSADLTSTGTALVAVSNPSGLNSTNALFTISSAYQPAIAGLSPGSVVAGSSSITVRVNGSGFLPGAVVSWNGTALPTEYVSRGELIAHVSAAYLTSPGTDQVVVKNPGGNASTASPFAVLWVPTIEAIGPGSVAAGASAFTLTVAGANFDSGATIQWNGTPLTTNDVSSDQLTATVKAGLVSASGDAIITVVNGDGMASGGMTLVIDNPPAPTLSGLYPSSAFVGSAAVTITLAGTNFSAGATVAWNLQPLTTKFVSATQLTAVIPATDLNGLDTGEIRVTNPLPTGGVTDPLPFAVITPDNLAAPKVTSLSPTKATYGSAGLTLTIKGTGFSSGSIATWNATPLSTTYVSATEVTAYVPVGNLLFIGNQSVGVVNADGQSSAAAAFSVTSPAAPTLTSISPNTAPVGRAGQTITATGSGFTPDASVEWNGTPLQTHYVGKQTLTAYVPAGYFQNAGTDSVTVSSVGGASSAVTYTVTATRISLKVGTITRGASSGPLSVPITLANTGYELAPSVSVSAATLATASTTSSVPIALGSLPIGSSAATTLVFAGSAGNSGASVTLTVSGSYGTGAFSLTQSVTLP